MSSKLLRDAVLVSIVVGGGFFALTQREAIYEFIGIHPSDIVDARANRLEETDQTDRIDATMLISGSSTSINKAADSHFWAEARVNSGSVRFLVDTGASIIALTPHDAQKAGVNLQTLRYTSPIDTAAGRVMAAPLTLDLVSVGNVTVRNVRAVVIREGLPQSLLGMSYLGELQKVEVSKNMMILRQ
ncbi:MAG: TIGR02281 family clan AA aspartic protease [Robiginitomaculum sp.]|nr:TIGR02281 family clan AA aspartic protease [Robiginitomaculum sp.]